MLRRHVTSVNQWTNVRWWYRGQTNNRKPLNTPDECVSSAEWPDTLSWGSDICQYSWMGMAASFKKMLCQVEVVFPPAFRAARLCITDNLSTKGLFKAHNSIRERNQKSTCASWSEREGWWCTAKNNKLWVLIFKKWGKFIPKTRVQALREKGAQHGYRFVGYGTDGQSNSGIPKTCEAEFKLIIGRRNCRFLWG